MLELLELIHASGLQLQKDGTVQQRLPVLPQLRQKLHHVLQVAFRLDGFRHVVSGGHELVAAGGVLHDLPLFACVHQPVVHPQGHAASVCKLGQDCLGLGGGRVFPNYPDAAVAVAQDIVIRKEFHDAGGNQVQKFLGVEGLGLLRRHDFSFVLHACTSSKYCAPSMSGRFSPFMLASK